MPLLKQTAAVSGRPISSNEVARINAQIGFLPGIYQRRDEVSRWEAMFDLYGREADLQEKIAEDQANQANTAALITGAGTLATIGTGLLNYFGGKTPVKPPVKPVVDAVTGATTDVATTTAVTAGAKTAAEVLTAEAGADAAAIFAEVGTGEVLAGTAFDVALTASQAAAATGAAVTGAQIAAATTGAVEIGAVSAGGALPITAGGVGAGAGAAGGGAVAAGLTFAMPAVMIAAALDIVLNEGKGTGIAAEALDKLMQSTVGAGLDAVSDLFGIGGGKKTVKGQKNLKLMKQIGPLAAQYYGTTPLEAGEFGTVSAETQGMAQAKKQFPNLSFEELLVKMQQLTAGSGTTSINPFDDEEEEIERTTKINPIPDVNIQAP